MYLLLQVGGYLGAPITIGLVMLTAVIGVTLLKRQGLATLLRGQQRMAEGQLPAVEIAEGLLLAVAGPLLLTPGFVTDAAGFVLLVPAFRQQLALRLGRRLTVVGGTGPMGASPGSGGQAQPPGSVIEGEFERADDPPNKPPLN